MTPESLLLPSLALALLVCQWMTFRLLKDSQPHFSNALGILKDSEPHLKDITTNFGDVGEGINESLMELMRIGADVADQIDSIASGARVVASPSLSPQVDIQSTILSLIADKFLAGNDGGKTKQIRTISEEDDTPPESITSEYPETN